MRQLTAKAVGNEEGREKRESKIRLAQPGASKQVKLECIQSLFRKQKSAGRSARAHLTSVAIRPVSRKTNRSTRFRDGSSEYGTSRWEHANCRPAGRSPSLRWESSAHPGSPSQLELSRRNG